jgi:uncharacterized membrane protein YgaE (UPF0421/DUF939 family)
MRMNFGNLGRYVIATKNLPTPRHAVRTAVAASVSLLVARLLRLPNDYWAAVSCIVVMQSTLGTELAVSVQRFVGTAVGAAAGALVATFFAAGVLAFGASLFAIGLFCWVLRIDRSAFRYAGIALAIVMLAPHAEGALATAFHRFLEVSLGIAVALLLNVIWPEGPTGTPESGSSAAETRIGQPGNGK